MCVITERELETSPAAITCFIHYSVAHARAVCEALRRVFTKLSELETSSAAIECFLHKCCTRELSVKPCGANCS